jgi:hypothetical protein
MEDQQGPPLRRRCRGLGAANQTGECDGRKEFYRFRQTHETSLEELSVGGASCFPLVLYFCHSFRALIFAFIVRGLKEFGEPTREALIMQLAPKNRKVAAFGAYYLCRDTIVCLSAFAGAFLWEAGPKANFMTAFAFGVLGAIWFAAKGARMRELFSDKEFSAFGEEQSMGR